MVKINDAVIEVRVLAAFFRGMKSAAGSGTPTFTVDQLVQNLDALLAAVESVREGDFTSLVRGEEVPDGQVHGD